MAKVFDDTNVVLLCCYVAVWDGKFVSELDVDMVEWSRNNEGTTGLEVCLGVGDKYDFISGQGNQHQTHRHTATNTTTNTPTTITNNNLILGWGGIPAQLQRLLGRARLHSEQRPA